jgi:hypothetical protein
MSCCKDGCSSWDVYAALAPIRRPLSSRAIKVLQTWSGSYMQVDAVPEGAVTVALTFNILFPKQFLI